MTTSLLIKTTNHYTTNSQGKHSHFVEKKVNEIIKEISDDKFDDLYIITKFNSLISQNNSQNQKEIIAFLKAYRIKGTADNLSLLHYSAKHLRSNLCNFFIDIVKIDPNTISKPKRRTPLQMLVVVNQINSEINETALTNTFKILIEQKADFNGKDQSGLTVLHRAILKQNIKLISLLLELENIDINAEDNIGLTPLHMAFKSGLDDIAAILIDRLDAENLIRSSSDCLPVFAALELKEEKLDLVVKMLEKIYFRSQLYLSHTLLYKLNAHKHSILQVAIENNHLNIVEVIIKRFYPDYNKLDSNGNTPTLLAAEAGNIAVLNILVKYNAISSLTNSNNDNPLHIAALKNRFAFITEFIKLEAEEKMKHTEPSITQTNRQQQTPFFSAVLKDNVKCLEALVQSDHAKLNTVDYEGNSILHYCARHNNIESLRFMLKSNKFNETLFIANNVGELPLHMASKKGNIEVFKLILTKFYDGTFEAKDIYLNAKDMEGKTCFHWACINGFSNIIEYLVKDLKLLFLLEATDNDNNTPLHLAAMFNHLSVVEILITQEVNLSCLNYSNETALLISTKRGYFDIARVLLNKFDSLSSGIDEMQSLHYASEKGAHEIVELLLKKGTKIDFYNSRNENCLDVAIKFNQKEVIKILLNDKHWYTLIQVEPKVPKSRKSIIQMAFNRDRDTNKVYAGENPQLYHLFEKKMWDMYMIILDNTICKHDKNTYDFTVLDPPCKSVNKHPLMLLARSGQEALLTHSVTQKLLYLKWRTIPRFTFYSYIILYIVYLSIFGMYSMELTDISMESSKLGKDFDVDRIWITHNSKFHFPIIILLMIISIKILVQIFFLDGLSYIISMVNWLEILSILSTSMVLFSRQLSLKTQYSSIAILSMFTYFTFLIQKLKVIGVYVLAFRRTLLNSAKFLPVFLIIYTSFVLSFRVRVDSELFYFNSTASASFLNGITMMMGDFQTHRMGVTNSVMNYVLYVSFICVMSVIILNLFVGIAVGEIKQTLDEADIQQISMRIVYLLKVQDALKFFERSPILKRIFNMHFTVYCYERNENKVSKLFHRYLALMGGKLQSNHPEINLVDPQTRLEESLLEMSLNNKENFKAIKAALQEQIVDVNDKLNKSKQRLEDVLIEMSRKTVDNFETSAEDSSVALLGVETSLLHSQQHIQSSLNHLELLTHLKIRAARESIIQHIKNLDQKVNSQHCIVLDMLNSMLSSSLKHMTEKSDQLKDMTSSEFSGVNSMLAYIDRKMDGFKTDIDELSHRMYELQRDLSEISVAQVSTRRSSVVEPIDPTNRNKLTPYINAFKSRKESNPDEIQGHSRAGSEVGERGPSVRVPDKSFVDKISKWEQKAHPKQQQQHPTK